MSTKVSIVIPCYNKKNYIGKTFDSILAQKWNNIELIIVNDGSTDGTRDVITTYEQRFRNRGYDAVIIDQENQGLAASVCTGLSLSTGELVCQLDADDELDSRFVSIMAEWLIENPDYKWAACDASLVCKDTVKYLKSFPVGSRDCKIENWIFSRIRRSICMYMIRSDYLKHCKILETFYTAKNANQEQQIFFPLVAGKGKIKYFKIPMYINNHYEPSSHRSYINTYDSIEDYFTGRFKAAQLTIQYLPIEETEKKRLNTLVKLNLALEIIQYSKINQIASNKYIKWKNELSELLNSCLNNQIDFNQILSNISSFRYALGANVIGEQIVKPKGRIIVWGALGGNAKYLLPYLYKSYLKPDELWDISGDGIIIIKPNIGNLCKDDMILIMPATSNYNNDIRIELENISFKNYIVYAQIESFCLFPQLYDGSVKFAI